MQIGSRFLGMAASASACLLVLSGCATAYVAPSASEPQARLSLELLTASSNGAGTVSVSNVGSCEEFSRVTSLVKGHSLLSEKTSHETTIPAGRMVSISGEAISTMAYSCEHKVKFVPERGAIYHATLAYFQPGCELSLYRMDESGKRQPIDHIECVPPELAGKIRFAGQVAAKDSVKGIRILLTEGESRGSSSAQVMPAAGALIAVGGGLPSELQFHRKNQKSFAESLGAELVRLGLGGALNSSATPVKGLQIQLAFNRTEYKPANQSHVLDVSMKISDGVKSVLYQYQINSGDGRGLTQPMRMTASESKVRAAQQLLDQMIPDVDRFIADN